MRIFSKLTVSSRVYRVIHELWIFLRLRRKNCADCEVDSRALKNNLLTLVLLKKDENKWKQDIHHLKCHFLSLAGTLNNLEKLKKKCMGTPPGGGGGLGRG